MSAARPVSRRGVVPLDRDLDVLLTVEEVVDGLTVSARDDHGRSAESMDPLRQLRLSNSLLLGSCENLRLREVRRHHRGQREQPLDQRLDRSVLEQLGARAGDHHRVDDQRNGPLLEKVGDRLDQTCREQHPGLRHVDADVIEHSFELRVNELGRQLVDRRHAHRVLRGQRDQRGHAMTSGRGERLQVGLDPGAPARIRRGDSQTAWRQ